MPFNVANAMQLRYPDPIGVDQLKRRNALADRDQQLQEQNSQVNRNYLSAQMDNMQRDDARATSAAQEAQAREFLTNGVQAARQNPTVIPQLIAEGKRRGFIPPEIPDNVGPEEVEAFAVQLGLPPPPLAFEKTPEFQKLALEQQNRLALEGERGRQDRLTAASKPKTTNAYVPLSPEEIAAAGLPPGSSAQKETATGKIEVLSKRDATGGLSQKDATTAKMKLNTVKLARQQLNRIRDQFEGPVNPKTRQRDPSRGIKGTFSAGPGSQAMFLSERGQKFDAAVDQMRSTLTALTRVPGVGAMSDYETKLDQAKFPSRTKFEGTTQQQIDDLDGMLNLIETGYSDLLSGNAPAGGPPQEDPLGIR
jgi:hypothetical protein